MVKLVKHITQWDSERGEVFALNESDAEDIMDAFQEVQSRVYFAVSRLGLTRHQILDGGLDDSEDRSQLKQLMSALVRKASGLPDSMFISGVALARGQCSIGGTFGDIYKTVYRDQPVALKFLRILGSSPAEKRKTCKVRALKVFS